MGTEASRMTEQIIERFGGIRPMAAKLDTPVTTIQGWKKRGIIPQPRHSEILAAAAREAIALDPNELAETDPNPLPKPDTRSLEPVAILPADAPARRRSAAAIVALTVSLLVLLAVAGAGFVGWRFYFLPLQARVAALESQRIAGAPAGELADRVARLEADLAQRPKGAPQPAGDQLAALQQQVSELKATASDTDQLAKRLSDLQLAAGGHELLTQSIRDIQSSTAATQGEVERLGTQLSTLVARLDQVDTVLADRRQQSLRAEAVILGVGQLRAALRQSKPFAKEAAGLRALVSADPEMLAVLDRIQPLADDGVSTLDELRSEFSRLAPQVVRSAVVGNGESWWRQALYHVESVVSIRRVGESAPGDAVDGIVARAEAKLENDDLEGATSALQSLAGMPADVVQSWIHEAQQRLMVDGAESELTRLAIDRVAAGNPQPTPASAPAQAAPAERAQ